MSSHDGCGRWPSARMIVDRLAVAELGPERDPLAVDLGADAAVADAGVDGVGEVDRGGAARELHHLALRGEAEDLVGEHLELHVLEEVLGDLGVVEAVGDRAQPVEGVDGEGVLEALAVAVGPVGGDAGLGDGVHLAGADLHLDALAVAARDGGVDRAVAVRLRLADVVLEAAGHRAPALVDGAEGGVAVADRVGDDAEAVDVGEAGEGLLLLLHLAPDRVGLLLAPDDLGVDLGLAEDGADVLGDLGDHVAALAAQLDEAADDRLARLGVEDLEAEVLELVAHPLHAHAAGERARRCPWSRAPCAAACRAAGA